MRKLFLVRIDNDPGAWKSGDDPTVLVLAETKEDAIQLVKDGWGYKWYPEGEYPNTTYIYEYGMGEGYDAGRYISDVANFSAAEIRFKGIEYVPIREAKIRRIDD